MSHEPSHTLVSPTFLGLLLAQFTATFNDQAIHMVAIFYASDVLVRYLQSTLLDEKAVVAIVTACFITPFLIFSPFAGLLADRYSKRTIIVFWKVAEVIMMSVALLGLSLPHLGRAASWNPETVAGWSAALVVSTVLMMGTHSTFFVPAKYGVMPEILHTSVLSRGNGLLEGTSFAAQIFGTSAGGILYALCKSHIGPGELIPGDEWRIGLLLVGLAVAGTLTAFFMKPVPAADPARKLTWNWWKPLQANLSILWRSKPLTLAVTGIAFAAFMTLFLRQALLYEAEIAKELRTAQGIETENAPVSDAASETAAAPSAVSRALTHIIPFRSQRLANMAEQSELRVALLIALVGFGVGVGSLVAGYLSGDRVELGLVPPGGFFMAAIIFVLAVTMKSGAMVVTCLFTVGIAAGLYIVPLYTMLQHRAPKESKGNVIAASNFLNVAGGIVAVAFFYLLTFGLEKIFAPELQHHEVLARPELKGDYLAQLARQLRIPQLLFAATGVVMTGMLVFLYVRLRDFPMRTWLWLRSGGRLHVVGLENLPSDGPVILATDCPAEASLNVMVATDRYTHVILWERAAAALTPLIRTLARHSGAVVLPATDGSSAWEAAVRQGRETLQRGEIVAIAFDDDGTAAATERLVAAWQTRLPAQVIPVHCEGRKMTPGGVPGTLAANARIIIGAPLPPQTTLAEIRAALKQLEPGLT